MSAAPHPVRRWQVDTVSAAVTLAAVLATLASAAALRAVAGFSAQNVVVAVVLTLTLTRLTGRAGRHHLIAAPSCRSWPSPLPVQAGWCCTIRGSGSR